MDHELRQVVTVRMTTYAVMRSFVLCKSLVTPPLVATVHRDIRAVVVGLANISQSSNALVGKV